MGDSLRRITSEEHNGGPWLLISWRGTSIARPSSSNYMTSCDAKIFPRMMG